MTLTWYLEDMLVFLAKITINSRYPVSWKPAV